MERSVAISVNGEVRSAPAGMRLAALLAELGLDARTVAVERNRVIVPRSTFAEVALQEGDRFEIVQFVGGG
jgi:thiazole synthase